MEAERRAIKNETIEILWIQDDELCCVSNDDHTIMIRQGEEGRGEKSVDFLRSNLEQKTVQKRSSRGREIEENFPQAKECD